MYDGLDSMLNIVHDIGLVDEKIDAFPHIEAGGGAAEKICERALCRM